MTDRTAVPLDGSPGGGEPTTIPALVDAAAERWPDLDAVVEGTDGSGRISYADLSARTRRAAAAFVAAGVRPGDRVAIWAPNSARWIVAFLGLSSAGAVLVPLNTRFKGPEAAYVLEKSRARMLVTSADFLGQDYRAMLQGVDLPHLEETLAFETDWDGFLRDGDGAGDEVARRAATVAGTDPLDLMFTSGTTGKPKGVVGRHGPTVRAYSYYAANLGIEPGDRYLLVNPLFHSFGVKAGLVAALTAGATLYPMPVFDAAAVADVIEREAITVFPGPPTVYYSLLELPPERRRAMSSLRLAVTGAATVPVELLRRMRDELGFDVVLTAYGLTECGGLVTMCRAGDPLEVVSATAGCAIPGVEVAVVGPGGDALPPGSPGEVVVRGYPVADGYFEDDQATAEAVDPAGWFHTGDVGVLDERGGLRITDRLKDMYIVGGFNAYPAEIEAVLTEMPGVSQAAVVGVPDDRLGEVGMAFVVARRGVELDPDEVVRFARSRLANFKVPRTVEVVSSLPLNAAGKVVKHELRARVASPVDVFPGGGRP